MLLQSRHSNEETGLDAYFTCIEAVKSLIDIEDGRLPSVIWEPACGDGAIVKPLRETGRCVIATDIVDYGCPFSSQADYLTYKMEGSIGGIITNPPYRLAMKFLQKALTEVDYVAFLLRTNFLESTSRYSFFKTTPPSRVWISSRRLPMMHRYGWEGPKAPSNTCHAWFVWDKGPSDKGKLYWFDWKEIVGTKKQSIIKKV